LAYDEVGLNNSKQYNYGHWTVKQLSPNNLVLSVPLRSSISFSPLSCW